MKLKTLFFAILLLPFKLSQKSPQTHSGVSAERRSPSRNKRFGFLPKAATLVLLLPFFSHAQELQSDSVELLNFNVPQFIHGEKALLLSVPPQWGTFFSLQLTNLPPLPYNPAPGVDVYSFGNVFLVDDRAVDYVTLREETAQQMSLDASGPPSPGEGGSGDDPGNEFPPAYSDSGLKLTMPVFSYSISNSVTNGVMNFTLMESDTNWVYDVYWTPIIPTNRWRLLGQTVFGSTNFSFPILTNDMAFFRLGLMTDSDGDGLPDAFEFLVTGTSPSLPDSNSNGIYDADEDHDGNGIPNLTEYTRVTHAGVFASLPNAMEGGTNGEFTFFLPKPASTNNTPLEFYLGGNAELNFDFTLTTTNGTAASNTVYFAAGSSVSKLRVTPTNDMVQASRPGFVTVTVTNYSDGLWDERVAVVNLIDNDLPTLSVSPYGPIAIEPEGVTNNGVFRFTRLGSNTTSLSFSFSLSGNTTNGIDYNTVATTTNFAAGSNIVDVIIIPKTNNIFTGPRQIIATISTNPTAYTIGNGSTSILMIDNDLPSVQVIAADSDARETGPKAGKFALLRTGNTGSPLIVTVGISGSALNSNDYSFLTNVFVIPAATNRLDISVTPIADGILESSETVVMTLKGSADYTIGITNAATVFIDDSNATSFSWTLLKQASSYHTTPFAIDSPGIVEIYRSGSCRVATNIPYQIYSNSTYNMSYMRVSGNVTNNQVRFEANSNLARVFLTAAIPGNTDNNAGGYFTVSNLFMASSFPIHFLSADRFVKISIVQTNAVEGTTTVAKLRATRLKTGDALNIQLSALPNGTAATGSYNLTNSGIIALGTTTLTGDLNISANADSTVQGWRSLMLGIFLNDSTIAYQLPENYLVFIRDNVTDPTGLSEPDTDNDGLSDLWEQAHGLDPLTPDDTNADPDRNGLGLFDEYQLGLNPFASDPGPNYLPIKMRVLDTGKVNNGSSCAVCHTTEMRVNSYRLFAQQHGIAEEKTFYFRKGTNYPVSLNELVNNIPRPNSNTGSPTTTATYSAEFLASKTNLPPQFFITDAGSRIGSNKFWTTYFPTPAQNPVATLIVPRIDITFTNVSGNTALDTNSNWNGGMRIFPDQLSPTDSTARNVVRVRVTTTPSMPGKQVRLKSFDVDDPTPAGIDDQFLIDTNDVGVVKGNDNRGTPQAGTLSSTLLTLVGVNFFL